MKHKMTRLRALTGLGSLITAAGCAGSPAVHSLLPGGARAAAPGGARIDPSQYFRVVKSKVAPLNLPRYRKSSAARSATSTTSYDPLSGTTVVSDGAGNSVWYDSQGGALMAIAMSQLSDRSGVSLTMTANDGTQRSSYIPTSSAFDGTGTTTVGALTMSSDPSSGQYVGNYQTDSGVVAIASTQSALGDFTTTLPDGSTFTVPQAAVSGLVPSTHARHPQDISNPYCVAANRGPERVEHATSGADGDRSGALALAFPDTLAHAGAVPAAAKPAAADDAPASPPPTMPPSPRPTMPPSPRPSGM